MATAKQVLDDYLAGDMTLAEIKRDFATRRWDPAPEEEHGDIPQPSDNAWDVVGNDPRLGPNTYQQLARAYMRSSG